jgi:dienelactone hydrolase
MPFAVMTWFVGSLLSASAQVPLPDDIAIAPPASTVAKEQAAFSGSWLGSWGGDLPTALIVEQVHSNGTANVIYAWGEPPMKFFKPGWVRQTAKIDGHKLEFISGGGADVEFSLETNGLLFGHYQISNSPPSEVELRRLTTTNIAAIVAATKQPMVTGEEVRIPVHSHIPPTDGLTYQLQTTIFRQSAPGKHPVMILNHGSTGPGIIPATYAVRGGNDEMFFQSLGYTVVIPMCKGRGASDGPNVEENFFLPSDIQLDSAIEDLDAVIGWVRAQPDMDYEKIVLAGASRGGMLSVAYAGRFPTNVIGVINFSGGWFGEGMPGPDFNSIAFADAGRLAKVPMLWLYADHDSYYSLKYIEGQFAKFCDAGGQGELVKYDDVPGNGHFLSQWVDRWQGKATDYLKRLPTTAAPDRK